MASLLQYRRMGRLVDAEAVANLAQVQAHDKGSDDDYLPVSATPNEPFLDPRSWNLYERILCTILVTCVGAIVSWAGSVTSAVAQPASSDLGVSETVESLATGLYFIGFGLGSLVAGPVSETLGRNVVYTGAMFLFMVFIAASGAAPNIETQLVFRFLAGFFGNTPLTCAGGSLADLWSPEERLVVVPLYSVGIYDGSTLAPVVGGWIAQGASSGALSWRWAEWVTLIISAFLLLLILLFLPETYAPVLLQWKARHIRNHTGDQRHRAPIEMKQDPLTRRLQHAMKRPFAFLVKEPIILAIALYLILIYVVLFTFLNGFSFIFGDTYQWGHGLTGTAFVAIAVGQHLPLAVIPITNHWAAAYRTKRQLHGEEEVDPPENRLWIAMIGAIALPISLFWLGWTAFPSISPWSGLAAGVLFGFACVAIYIGFYMYVIDVYATYAASGLASTTVLRYIAAGAMVAPSIPMYERLGHQWTLTLFGIIAVIMGTIPFVFFRYGVVLRKKSAFARESVETS